jgi:hypothetical protein
LRAIRPGILEEVTDHKQLHLSQDVWPPIAKTYGGFPKMGVSLNHPF